MPMIDSVENQTLSPRTWPQQQQPVNGVSTAFPMMKGLTHRNICSADQVLLAPQLLGPEVIRGIFRGVWNGWPGQWEQSHLVLVNHKMLLQVGHLSYPQNYCGAPGLRTDTVGVTVVTGQYCPQSDNTPFRNKTREYFSWNFK